MGPNLRKKYGWQKIWKNKHENRNKHIAMYACTKFQLIWRTSDFGTKFPKNMNDKNVEKINIEIYINI